MANLIGQTFGNYQIVEQIGIGGMATVYKAYQANMDRFVALKVLPEQLAKDPQFFGRFEQEARTIAKLENKHILPVYDYGGQDGFYYLVMRYIGTGTLKDLAQEGPIPLALAVNFLTQIAEALQYAHDRGVIHRDIKTSNVLVDEANQCYLTDFGIAKLAASSSHFTSSGAIIGTPAYMSPEQCNGLPADARSDLYSLGIVLYEMLTGRVPFEAETPIAVVRMQIDKPLPSPRSVRPTVPEEIEQVVFRALAKYPEDRYGSVREFADALNAAFETFTKKTTHTFPATPLAVPPEGASEPTHPRSTTRASSSTVPVQGAEQRRGWLLWAAAVVVVSVVIIGLVTLLSGGDESDEAPTEVGAGGQVTDESTAEPTATVPATPDDVVAPGDVTPSEAAPTDEAPPTDEVASGAATPADQPAEWTTFTRTGGYDPGDMRLLATDQGLWMTSNGGLVFWTYDGVPTKYTSADGLAFNDIQNLAIDTAGVLWLAGGEAGNGVMRITTDGAGAITDIEHYDSSAFGLDSDYIWTLLPEADGAMLVGAYETYLEAWDGSEWYTPDLAQPDVLSALGDRVWDLTRTQDGTLWAAGLHGMARVVPGSDQWEMVELPEAILALDQEAVEVVALYEDPYDGALWVFMVTEPDYQFYTWQLVPSADADTDANPDMGGAWMWRAAPDWWPETPIFDILRTSDNMLWVVTYDTVLRVDPATDRQTTFTADEGIPGVPYFAAAEAPDGSLWLVTNSGLVHFTGQRWVPYSITNEPPYQDAEIMTQAQDGTLWFVADWGDVMNYRADTWQAVDYLDAGPRAIVAQTTSIPDDPALWIGTTGGLVRWHNDRAQWYGVDEGLADDSIQALAVDAANPNVLWVGTANGLNAFNTVSEEVTTWTVDDGLTAPGVSALYVDPAGVLWIGTGFDNESATEAGQIGVLRMEDDQLVAVGTFGDPFHEDDSWLMSFAMDGQGHLWAGTDSHLYRYDGTRWQAYSEDEGAPDWTSISDIQVRDDVLWVATSYDGLFRLDAVGWLHPGSAGIGSDEVYGLHLATDGSLWILTNDGITRLVGDPYAE